MTTASAESDQGRVRGGQRLAVTDGGGQAGLLPHSGGLVDCHPVVPVVRDDDEDLLGRHLRTRVVGDDGIGWFWRADLVRHYPGW